MARKKRQLRLKVHGDRRKDPDTRRLARAIVRIAIEQGTVEAQALADSLEHQEALRRAALTRQRAAEREARDGEVGDGETTEPASS